MSQKMLKDICSRFLRRLRLMLIQYGVLTLVFGCLAVAAALMFADWYFRFSADMRLLSLTVLLMTAATAYYLCLHRPLRHPWTDDDVLAYVDRIHDGGEDTLTAFRDLSQPEGMREWDTERGKEMVRESLLELEEKVRNVDLSHALRRTPIRNWQIATGVLVAAYLIAFLALRDPVAGTSYVSVGIRRILFPFAQIFWPQNTRILVQKPESGWRVPVGESLTIHARIDGVVPGRVDIVYQNQSSDLWITERMALAPGTHEATFTFKKIAEPLTFYCTGGDDREKRKYTVAVAQRPMITQVKATYVYPSYAMLPRTTVPSGQLTGLEGTKVTLEFVASSKLSKATIQTAFVGQEPDEPFPVDSLQGNRFSHTLTLTRSGTYTLHLVDTEGLTNGRREQYEIRVEPDAPPTVTLEEPLRDLILTPHGKVRVRFKAEDDWNLTALNVLLAPEGGKGEALSEERITGPFWDRTTTLHRVGKGDFDLDFLKEKDQGFLKGWKIDKGAELELWVRAVDCNPVIPGITESPKIRISIMHPTDFMSEVVLKAKMLMTDARTGWFNVAGAFHDGRAWVHAPQDDAALEKVLEQQQTAERAAHALALRFPEIIDHMNRNRMTDVFMSRRLDKIGTLIAELQTSLPDIGRKIAAGKPATIEEAAPERRRAKMSAAIQALLPDQNRAAWQMRLLYNWLADWVALQSVLLKTRRMEELQTEVNTATRELVKRTLGREARELEDKEVRDMKEVANQQETVQQMDEAVEKELAQLVYQADKDGRKKVFDALGRALLELRDNRINDRLKRAAMAILDARGEVVREDQEQVLRTLAVVNRGLILAGEQVPEDPSDAMFAAVIDDPREKIDAAEAIASEGVELADDVYKALERVRIVADARADTLDETLSLVFLQQEDVRNRTRFIAERATTFPRYVFLRTGLTALRQERVAALLKKAASQIPAYGKVDTAEALPPGSKPPVPDPTVDQARKLLAAEVGGYLARAEEAQRLVAESQFGRFVTDTQTHIHEAARNLRVYIQAREKLHGLWQERVNANFLDSFGQPYLLRESNLRTMIDVARNLEWALVLQAGAQREAALLAEARRAALRGATFKQSVERITAGARERNAAIAAIIRQLHQTVAQGIADPTEPERFNERVFSMLTEKILAPLPVAPFDECAKAFEAGAYDTLAMKQEGLRRALSDTIVTLYDLFESRVPPKPPVFDPLAQDYGTREAGVGLVIDYVDEKPNAVALRIEKEGAWIDAITGDPNVRKRLVERLRTMNDFDQRYSRLQSAYLQALAQRFEAKAKPDVEPEKEPEKSP